MSIPHIDKRHLFEHAPGPENSIQNLPAVLIDMIFSAPCFSILNKKTSINLSSIYLDWQSLKSCIATSKIFRATFQIGCKPQLQEIEKFISDLIPRLEGNTPPEKISLLKEMKPQFIYPIVGLVNLRNQITRIENEIIENVLVHLDAFTLKTMPQSKGSNQFPIFFENIFRVAQIYRQIPIALKADNPLRISPSDILYNLVDLGEMKRAIDVANKHFSSTRSDDFAAVVKKLCINDKIELADKFENAIPDGEERSGIFEFYKEKWVVIAQNLIRNGTTDRANHIKNEYGKASVLREIVKSLANEGKINDALDLTKTISLNTVQASALRLIADAIEKPRVWRRASESLSYEYDEKT